MNIFIAFGANQNSVFGTPEQTFQWSVGQLQSAEYTLKGLSPLYTSRPLEERDIPDFTNACGWFESDRFGPFNLLKTIKEIEYIAGRRDGDYWGSRPLDLDIIDFNRLSLNFDKCYLSSHAGQQKPKLVLPHPELHRRDFVLKPLSDINSFWHHPITGQSVLSLLKKSEIINSKYPLIKTNN